MGDVLVTLLAGFGMGVSFAAIITWVYSRRVEHTERALCVLISDHGVGGTVHMRALDAKHTEFSCVIRGMAPGLHGFHVHQYGDLREGCASTCSHYNPTNEVHGSAVSAVRHAGDLGNIEANALGVSESIVRVRVPLMDIMGRAIVIHADEDDLGLCATEESRSTGTAGARIACGVIVHAQSVRVF